MHVEFDETLEFVLNYKLDSIWSRLKSYECRSRGMNVGVL